MSKRRDLLDRISPDDPNYELVERLCLEAWPDSYGLVAEAFAGEGSLPKYVEGCVRTFAQGAQALVDIEDEEPVGERCRSLDRLAKKYIRVFRKSLAPESERLGLEDVEAATNDLYRG